MFSFNQMIIIGKVYELKSAKTNSGEDVAQGTIQYQNYKGGKNENIYFDFVLFGKNATSFNTYVKQADVVQVVGKMIYETYKDKEGKDRRKYKLVGEKFLKLRAAYADELKEDDAKTVKSLTGNAENNNFDDDIPF